MSAIASIFNFLIELLRWLSDFFGRRADDKAVTWQEIQDKRSALALALADGRVSDVAILRKELEVLMERYMRGVRYDERNLRRFCRNGGRKYFTGAVAVAALLLFAGCIGSKAKPSGPVFVLGDRINVVKPGAVLEVPEYIKPARCWYLVDNVAIQHWLGIPVEFDDVTPKISTNRVIYVRGLREDSE